MDLKYFRYGCNVAKNDALIAVGKRLKKCINKPYLIYYSITYRCNAKCITCLRWKNESLSEELTLEKHKDIVSQLHRWLGVFGLSFTGGEAFVKEDFLDLVEHAYKLNISTNVATNGIVFEGEMRDKIAETGLNSIIFSLNSIEPDIHDRYKGILGLHEKIVEAIKYIKKRHPRIRVGVLCLIAKDTYKNLGDFVEWVNDLGVDTIDFQPIYGIHSDKVSFDLPVLGSHSTPLAEIDDIDELKKQINFLIQKQEDGVPIVIPKTNLETIPKYFQDIKKLYVKKECLIGFKNMFIAHTGDIQLCPFFPPIGNVADGSIKDMWFSEKAQKQRLKMLKCENPCIMGCAHTYGISDKLRHFFLFQKLNMKDEQKKSM